MKIYVGIPSFEKDKLCIRVNRSAKSENSQIGIITSCRKNIKNVPTKLKRYFRIQSSNLQQTPNNY